MDRHEQFWQAFASRGFVSDSWAFLFTNDGLTRSGSGYFTAVPIWQQWASNG